jgi:hypothetical protein
MCRNIKPLYNFDPEATEEEINAASLQFVRKLTGFNSPSKINKDAFDAAVDEISSVINTLFSNLTTKSKPKNREEETMKAKIKFEKQMEYQKQRLIRDT